VDTLLRHKACAKFASIPHHQRTKLFFNLDSRVLDMPDYSTGNTAAMLARLSLSPSAVCFEISERHEVTSLQRAMEVLKRYKGQLHRIAIDDYGSGYSGLQLLYHCEPDFIKIDRFFIEGIADDARKRLFVSNVVSTAHMLGISVVGEGVETERELLACREIGCDLLQGYLIAMPLTDVDQLKPVYGEVAELGKRERRRRAQPSCVLEAAARDLEPVSVNASMQQVLDAFRATGDVRLVVVVNELREPVGIIRESDVRRYLYNPYGWALLTGPSHDNIWGEFVTPCPKAETTCPIERIVETYSLDDDSHDGVMLTDNGVYVGFLTASDLLKVVSDANLALARDQNPLTRLPGNTMISDFMAEAVEDDSEAYCLAHLDFDNFKPFNDRYGFRRGDRAIQMFADILRTAAGIDSFFAGHLGGDDFFAGFRIGDRSFAVAEQILAAVVGKFRDDVVALYSAEDRKRGFIVVPGRDGIVRDYPLLTVTAAVLRLPVGRPAFAPDQAAAVLADIKLEAKKRPGEMTAVNLTDTIRTAVRAEAS